MLKWLEMCQGALVGHFETQNWCGHDQKYCRCNPSGNDIFVHFETFFSTDQKISKNVTIYKMKKLATGNTLKFNIQKGLIWDVLRLCVHNMLNSVKKCGC